MIGPMHVRLCPECGEEFRPEIVTCSDCGATLVDHWEGEPEEGEDVPLPPRPETPSAARPPEGFKPVASASTAIEIDPIARTLGAAGIVFAVTGAVNHFSLLVAPEDVERALALLGVGEAPPEAHATCPACGADVQGAGECPDCGLALAGDPEGLPDPGSSERLD
jgi:hypothetical protein